jgi:hypothetical protein
MLITDLEPYRPHIDAFDSTEERKLELVNMIATITEMVLEKKFRLLEINNREKQ